jgi:tetratricopeptide (TPR) repeat protein
MAKYEELLRSKAISRFTGRGEIIARLELKLASKDGAERPIVDLYGQAGVGKTAVVTYFDGLAKRYGAPTAIVNIKQKRTALEVMFDLWAQLKEVDPKKDLFRDFHRILDRLRRLEAKLAKAIATDPKLTAEGMLGAGATVGGTAGALVGGSAGGPLGALAGAGIGTVLGATGVSDEFRRILRLGKLNEEEIEVWTSSMGRLSQALGKGLEGLAADRGHVLISIDNYEHATQALDDWLRTEFIPHLDTRILILMAGRFQLTSSSGWRDLAAVIDDVEVSNFTEAETIAYWKQRGLNNPVLAGFIHRQTAGYPLINAVMADSVSLLSSGATIDTAALEALANSPRTLDAVVERFLSESPDRSFDNAIRRCSVPRWFDLGLVRALVPGNPDETLEKLKHLTFCLKNLDGSLSLHDSVRTILARELKARDYREYRETNETVANYLAARNQAGEGRGVQSLVDELYHRLCANESVGLKLAIGLVTHGESVRRSDLADVLLDELSIFDFESPDGRSWRSFFVAERSLNRGDWNLASKELSSLIQDKSIDAQLRTVASESLAKLLTGRGSYDEAYRLQRSLVDQIVRNGAPKSDQTNIDAFCGLIETCGILSKFGEAASLFDQALKVAEGNDVGQARTLLAIATVQRLEGTLDAGLDSAQRAVSLLTHVGYARLESRARIQLARLLTHLGQWYRGSEELQHASKLLERSPSEYDLGNVYLFTGNIERRRRHWTEAKSLYDQALTVHSKMQSLREIGPLYGSMGVTAYHLGKRELALEYLNESLKIKEQQNYLRGAGFTHKYLGDYFMLEGRFEEAFSQFRTAMKIGADLSVPYLHQWARLGLGRLTLLSKDADASRLLFVASVGQSAAFKDLEGIRLGYLAICNAALSGTRPSASELASAISMLLEYNPYSAYELVDDLKNLVHELAIRGEFGVSDSSIPMEEIFRQFGTTLNAVEGRRRAEERIPQSEPMLIGRSHLSG